MFVESRINGDQMPTNDANKKELRVYDLDDDGVGDHAELWQGDSFLGSYALSEAAYGDWSFPEDRFDSFDFEAFGCLTTGLAGSCLDTNLDSYLTLGVGLPGWSAGVTQDASNFLSGHGVSVVTPYGGLGAALPSGDGGVMVGSRGPSYTYGIPVSEILDWLANAGTEFSNGTYDQFGRPYDPPSDPFM